MTEAPPIRAVFRVIGMDCTDDAAALTRAAQGARGITAVEVSLASGLLTLTAADPLGLVSGQQAAEQAGFRLLPAESPVELSTSYRRALWIVVLLNGGYGVVESVAGFVAHSQALKADALDFLGDGLITFVGILALTWPLRRRARVAMAQGLFLGALGIGVLGSTFLRVFVQQSAQAEIMGVVGLFALAVNLAAAGVLLPHRSGDANARAIWLFSRNDAIGNVAVMAASGLVAWTGSVWPDLLVAAAIAALFLHSAATIVVDANTELHPR